MSNIVIIGNGIPAISAIETIRAEDQGSPITLLCPEGILPYDRTLLAAHLAKEVKEQGLHPKHASFFKEHGVDIVLNEQLSRVSTKRKYVGAESKRQFPYDRLLVTDLGAVHGPDIKGRGKEGIFDCAHYKSMEALAKHIPFIDNAVVCVSNFLGLNTACALKMLGKEVSVVSPAVGGGILPDVFDEETTMLLKQILEGKGLKVMAGNAVEEILGDGEVKAVRLKSGKVIAAQAVIFDDLKADTRVFSDGMPDGVDMAAVDQPSTGVRDFGLKVINGTCAGVVRRAPQGGREYMQFDGPDNVYKKIFIQDGHIVGFVLFNAAFAKEKLLRDLLEGKEVAQTQEQLFSEYFSAVGGSASG
ncbi:MAG: FAD-dependent oxidoreductase [Candidatus Omnitrophota bacterium]|nr:FAD-dependent oxidoreductase [Candidatus Omnitrophota bacterium]